MQTNSKLMIDQLIKSKAKKPTEILMLLQKELADVKLSKKLGILNSEEDPVSIVEEDIKHVLKYFN